MARVQSKVADSPERSRPGRQQRIWEAGGLVAAVNGVLLGVGGVYLTTSSVPVTIVAAATAVAVPALIALVHR